MLTAISIVELIQSLGSEPGLPNSNGFVSIRQRLPNPELSLKDDKRTIHSPCQEIDKSILEILTRNYQE